MPYGNVNAFRHFVERYQSRALAHARLLTRNEADAADAAQDAFVDAFRNLRAFDPARHFYAWFYVLLRNRCFKQQSRRGSSTDRVGRRFQLLRISNLKMVSLTFASWNRIGAWLRRIEAVGGIA